MGRRQLPYFAAHHSLMRQLLPITCALILSTFSSVSRAQHPACGTDALMHHLRLHDPQAKQHESSINMDIRVQMDAGLGRVRVVRE